MNESHDDVDLELIGASRTDATQDAVLLAELNFGPYYASDLVRGANYLQAEYREANGWIWHDDSAGWVATDEDDIYEWGRRLREDADADYSEWCSSASIDELGWEKERS